MPGLITGSEQGGIVTGAVLITDDGGETTPEHFTYLQPDGVSRYLQPDGVSIYLQP